MNASTKTWGCRVPSGKFSLAKAMIVIAIIAVDIAWLRIIMFGGTSLVGFDRFLNGHIFDYGMLGMFNALAFSTICLLPARSGRLRFFVGFELAGLLSLILYRACCRRWGEWLLPEPFSTQGWGLIPLAKFTNVAARAIGVDSIAIARRLNTNPFVSAVWTVVLTLPQLLLAGIGGLLAWRMTTRRDDAVQR